jgi:hypothetical protein
MGLRGSETISGSHRHFVVRQVVCRPEKGSAVHSRVEVLGGSPSARTVLSPEARGKWPQTQPPEGVS